MKHCVLFIMIALIVCPYFAHVHAVIQSNENPAVMQIEGDRNAGGVTMSYAEKIKMQNTKKVRQFLNSFFSFLQNTSSAENRSTTPTQTPTQSPSQLQTTPGQVNGTFTYFRQCDYRTSGLPPGCTIGTAGCCSVCSMGCGFTAVAGLISTLKRPIDPPAVVQMFTQYRSAAIANSLVLQQNPANAPFQTNCGGMYIADAKTALDREGLVTSNYLYRYKLGAPLETVVQDMIPYVKSGSYILAVTFMCDPKPNTNGDPTDGCGHFIVITDIKCTGNDCRVDSYDPYYDPASTSQPIDYRSGVNHAPYPLYRNAFAVHKP